MTKKVIVGLSGGVDSSVSAWLLQQQGYQVEGFFMKNWQENDDSEPCPSTCDLIDVMKVCDQLKIPLHAGNFSSQYKQRVFDNLVAEYAAGRTPNPDILCNSEIKFDLLLEQAKQLGGDYLATGHYAKHIRSHDNQSQLHCALDANKDQTYFLYALKQQQLAYSLFPLADFSKPQVRQKAQQLKLPIYDKKDSTGICFIGKRKFSQFMSRYLACQAGDIVDQAGKVIGQHQGAAYYTIGQRKHLNLGGRANGSGKPWYVASKDTKKNILLVVQDAQHPLLNHHGLVAKQLTWINQPAEVNKTYLARIRHRQPLQSVTLEQIDNQQLQLHFKQPQFAIAAGQSVVLYNASQCLGGGIIEQAFD